MDLENDTLPPELDIQAFETLYCLLTTDKPGSEYCKCFNPCEERMYDTTVSVASPWPNPAFQKEFYERFIEEKTYAYKFKPYEYILEAFSNGSIDAVGKSRFRLYIRNT